MPEDSVEDEEDDVGDHGGHSQVPGPDGRQVLNSNNEALKIINEV